MLYHWHLKASSNNHYFNHNSTIVPIIVTHSDQTIPSRRRGRGQIHLAVQALDTDKSIIRLKIFYNHALRQHNYQLQHGFNQQATSCTPNRVTQSVLTKCSIRQHGFHQQATGDMSQMMCLHKLFPLLTASSLQYRVCRRWAGKHLLRYSICQATNQ